MKVRSHSAGRGSNPLSGVKLHLHDAIPVPEALVTGLAVGELAGEASGALITAYTRHPLLAHAVARHPVALGRLDATPVTVTGCGRGR